MIKSFSNLFSCKKEWCFYTILTFIYSIFLGLKYLLPQPLIWNFLYDTFLFYLDATLAEFNIWYPRFGFWLYSIVFLIKLFTIVLIVFFVFNISKKLKKQFDNSILVEDFPFNRFLLNQVVISSVLLTYFIGLHFVFRYYFTSNFTDFQILIARGFLLLLVIQILRNILKHRLVFANYLKKFFLEPQFPYTISMLRILFFFYLAYIYWIKFRMLPTVSLSDKVSLPFIGWLIDILPINANIYTGFLVFGMLCCFFIVIGFRTRFFLILNAICVFYIVAAPNFFGKLWHEQFVIWITWFMAFSNCYDAFSVDAYLNKKPLFKSPNYNFPVRFVWIQFGIIYFWAGFYKLWDSGFEWTFGQSMVNQVQLEWLQAYDVVPTIRIDHYPIILYIAGLLAILFELTYILFLLRPKWRWISVIGGLIMHNLIGYFMYISFFTLLQVFYIFYIDFNPLFSKLKSKFTIENGFSKVSLYSGISILIINLFFGMFHIDTYPFSSYPSYSAIIPEKIKVIDFKSNKLHQTVHEIGLANHFRWEDYGWLEDNLIKDFQSGKNVQKRLENYWEIWLKRNPQLVICDTINVYLTERPVAPEGKDKVVCLKKMGIIINNSKN
ncbi:MAG: Vitamin K-dependent gamma-carboxylase [Bacteroidota bacterium]|jgi:hypothetical protein